MLILKSVEKCLKTVRRYISACAFLGSNQNMSKTLQSVRRSINKGYSFYMYIYNDAQCTPHPHLN